jgi:hypothetical protein
MFLLVACSLQIQCTNTPQSNESKQMTKNEMTAQGEYLVNAMGCGDCHTPKYFTQMGPMPDSSKLLSGHPANSPLPPIDTNALHPGYWYLGSADLTAWVGPWGISYTANLTPDSSTGIGAWTEEQFIGTLRLGKHLGMSGGRPILPPMPWMWFANMKDDDLKSVYRYLQSIPAISNQVPAPVSPPDMLAMAMKK